MATPPSKRWRSNSAGTHDNELVHSKTVWFEDGNLILEAEFMRFRVHRSILSTHSSIFQDMFMVPQPEAQVIVEECPLVHLSDDKEDVECFLRAIYDGKWYYGSQYQSIHTISAIVRMSQKYDCEDLRKDAIARLAADFPPTLSEWDAVGGDYTRIQVTGDEAIPIDVVNLAFEQSLRAILPSAYFTCIVKSSLTQLLFGVRRSDGTIAKLNPEPQQICVLGWEKLNNKQSKLTFAWLVDEHGDMYTDDTCDSGRRSRCDGIRAQLIAKLFLPSPKSANALRPWTDWVAEEECRDIVDGLCPECLEYAKDAHECGRQFMWSSLPSFFGLPVWQELKNE